MRIANLSEPGQQGEHTASAAFRAGRGWIPLAAGKPVALNPDVWTRHRRIAPAGKALAASGDVVRVGVQP